MGCCEVNSFLFAKNSDGHIGNLVMFDKPMSRLSVNSENNMGETTCRATLWAVKTLQSIEQQSSKHFMMCAEQGGSLTGKQQAIA